MNLPLFDALAFMGRDSTLDPFQFADKPALDRYFGKYGINRSLVASFTSFRLDPDYGNDLSFQAAEEDDRVLPCATMVPDTCLGIDDVGFRVRGLRDRGARALLFFPRTHDTTLDLRVVGGVFREIEKSGLPVFILGDEADLKDFADFASSFPELPFVYSGTKGRQRSLIPLFQSAPNLYLTIAPPFAMHKGIEEFCRHIGSERLLFASHFPVSEPGVVISYLLYAEIDRDELENIAFRNMDRLLNGIHHG